MALALAASGCGLFGPEEDVALEMAEQDIAFSDDPPTVAACENGAPCGDEILALCRGASADVCQLRPDGSGLRVLTTDANAPLPSPSPDGEVIALDQFGPDGIDEYELIDQSGVSLLSRTPGQVEAWRTDQELIVSDATGSYAFVDRTGATLGVIPPIAELDNAAFGIDSVSPDGAFLVAAVGSADAGYELWSNDLEAGTWTKLDIGDDMLTLQGWSAVDAWSPDATSFHVLTTNRDSIGEPRLESQLVRVHLGGSDQEVVASFSHDGLVGIVAAPVSADPNDRWLAAVRSETAVSLFDLRSGELLDQVRSAFTAGFPGMAWSADGEFLVVDGGWRDDGTQQLAVITVDRDTVSVPWLIDPGAFDEIHHPVALPAGR